MMDHAFEAANVSEGALDGTPHRLEQWRALLNVVKIGDLVMNLRRDPQNNTRDQFVKRLELISKRMPDRGRAVFIIDPEKYMQADSDQDWAIVVKQLPPKIKLVFAQRHDDVLATGEQFRSLINMGLAVRIPDGELDILGEQAVDELVRIRAGDMGHDEQSLRQAVSRYNGHPYAVPAALDLVAAGTAIEDLPTDPPPDCIAAAQWEKIGTGGKTGQLGDKAVALFQAYAVLEVAAPDDIVEVVAGITPEEHTSLTADGFLGPLVRREGDRARIYHAILADHIREELGKAGARPYHERAINELRGRLAQAEQENTAPDAFAAERLAVHVGAAEGDASFVSCFINECAEALNHIGRHDAFILLTELSLSKTSDPTATAALYGNLGLIHKTRGDLDETERLLRKSLDIDEQFGRPEDMAAAYGNLGLIHQTRGDLDEAEGMHRKALELNEQLGRLEGMANQYGNLGVIHQTRGDLDEAEGMHRKALAIEEQLGRLEGMAAQYGNLGVVHQTRGDLDEAEEMHRKALEINEQLGRLEGMAYQYGNLGLIHMDRGDLDESERLHRKALELNEQLGRLEGMAAAYGNLGLIHQLRGDLDESERLHRKALEINEQLGRLEGMAAQYANLGAIYHTRGDPDESERLHRRALEIEEKLDRLEGMANQYGNLGVIHQTRGDLAGARELWTKARDLFERIGMPQAVAKVQGWIDGLPD